MPLPLVTVKHACASYVPKQSSGARLFDALSALRLELESASYLICVQGARFDVHPSGLTSQMNGGSCRLFGRGGWPRRARGPW
jgi:hypothetical protein